ncbi:ABC transporter ATP-binding protein [Agromyces protaetiae]|uniref:ABC transporter ATP-binding protein n=1 Tax=Agromyces protaetiae TaxID=2509455 RepID=A0A4P6FDE9_9MICO|nr:ABC transporter ATP-binding protein [Agromyces protaetiae]QAY74142.1 ABC transporter ATP-binding protein [Agromyces protaetiae]
MITTPPAIEAERLAKTYRTGRGRPPVHALRGLDLVVPAGRVYGLLGPNGAGKSTTTKILTTLSTPTSGTARVGGRDVVADPAGVRALIGYVSQGASCDPLLTAEENLVLAARLRGMSSVDSRDRARRLLAEFGLDDAASRPVGKLSGGMRRRLDVAAALTHRPSVLFLDEPTTGLDPESRAAMWAEIRRLSAEDALTVVLTTHYLEEADRLADELMIIDRGREVVSGSAAALKSTLNGDTLRVELFEPDADAVRAAVEPLRGIRGLVVEVAGPTGALVARVEDASAAIGSVIPALTSAGIAFGAASVSAPTLDDVYLHYVGHTFAAAPPTDDSADPDASGPETSEPASPSEGAAA